jgi:hypothetical protein
MVMDSRVKVLGLDGAVVRSSGKKSGKMNGLKLWKLAQ